MGITPDRSRNGSPSMKDVKKKGPKLFICFVESKKKVKPKRNPWNLPEEKLRNSLRCLVWDELANRTSQ